MMRAVSMGARLGWMAAVLIAGCGGRLAVDYRSTATIVPPPPTASVLLQVRNARNVMHGGQTEQIGLIYSSWGGINPGPRNYSGSPINGTGPEMVTDTVRDATADALAHAGVAIRAGSPKLIASVREYWMDGPNVKRGSIVVAYDVVDAGGRVVWHHDAHGEASAMMTVGNGLVKMFRAALVDMAANACTAFSSPEFRAALRAATR